MARTVCNSLGITHISASNFHMGLDAIKAVSGFANNTGADQPALPQILISAFDIRILESIIYKLASGDISIFLVVSVVVKTGLKLALLETPKTGFSESRPIC